MTKSSRVLRLDTFEERVVPATFYLSQGGITHALRDATLVVERNGDTGQSTLAIRSPDLLRGSIHANERAVLYVPSWNGGWNRYVVQVVVPKVVEPPKPTGPAIRAPLAPPAPKQSEQTTTPDAAKESTGATSPGRSAVPLSALVDMNQTPDEAVANDSERDNATGPEAAQLANVPLPVFTRSDFNRRVPLVSTIAADDDVVAVAGATTVRYSPQSAEPPPAAEPEVVAPDLEAPVPRAAMPSAAPLTGLLPVELSAFESGVRDVLGRLADLDLPVLDDDAGAESYLWLTAGALVAAGLAQSAWARRTYRTERYALGFDSVWARWGGQNAGRLG